MARDDDDHAVGDEPTEIMDEGRHSAPAVDGSAEPGRAASPAASGPEPGGPTPADTNGAGEGSDASSGSPRPALDAAAGTPQLEPPPARVEPPGPVLVAVGLGLLTKDGWVFQDINLNLRPSSVAAIVGSAGTGRSCLLLALTGRMVANTGSLTVAGHSIRDRAKNVRAVTAVARVGSLVGPEPGLTVGESVTERCLIEDEPVQAGRARFAEACTALGLELEPTMRVGRLAGEKATLLAVALACVRVSAVIVLDDLDRDVSAAAQQRMIDALIRLARTGPTVVVSTTDRIAVMEADVVLDLSPMDGAAVWQIGSPDAPTDFLERQIGSGDGARWVAELSPGTPAAEGGVVDDDGRRSAWDDPDRYPPGTHVPGPDDPVAAYSESAHPGTDEHGTHEQGTDEQGTDEPVTAYSEADEPEPDRPEPDRPEPDDPAVGDTRRTDLDTGTAGTGNARSQAPTEDPR